MLLQTSVVWFLESRARLIKVVKTVSVNEKVLNTGSVNACLKTWMIARLE